MTDAEHFDQFYRAYRHRALAHVRYHQPQWPPDVVQDVAEDVWSAMYQRLGLIDDPVAYLFIALNNRIRDRQRQQRRERPISPEDLGRQARQPVGMGRADRPEEVAELRETFQEIRDDLLAVLEAVHQLPRRRREAYLLRVVVGLRSAQVAEILGTSVSAVDSLVCRARAALARDFSTRRMELFEAAAAVAAEGGMA